MAQRAAHRRPQALDRYRADEKSEDSWRHLACTNSGRYKWRKRYDAANPAGVQERATRPQHSPTRMPEHVVQAIVSLHAALRHNGTGGGATIILQALTQPGIEPMPARRTIDRMLRRYPTEGT